MPTYLLPDLREVNADHAVTHNGGHGPLTGAFLKVLKAWGPDALPALPEVVALLDDATGSLSIVEALAAMGPGAASAEAALRACKPLNWPGYHWNAAWAVSQMGGDRRAALRLIGDAVLTEEGPSDGPVHLLAEFGPAAAPYADRVRHIMENTDGFRRIAALALWLGHGPAELSISVLAGLRPADRRRRRRLWALRRGAASSGPGSAPSPPRRAPHCGRYGASTAVWHRHGTTRPSSRTRNCAPRSTTCSPFPEPKAPTGAGVCLGVCLAQAGQAEFKCFGQEARPWERGSPRHGCAVRRTRALPR